MSVRTRAQSRPSGSTHGVLVVDKPPKLTSHDVVGAVRRVMGTRRVGHAGTLDPMATGVLVVLLGEATKLSSILTTDRKSYEARIEWGSTTDSLDADGTVTKSVELSPNWLADDALLRALETERTRRLQIPPQVSAIKVDGQRAYARARKGETTELAARDVTIHELVALNSGPDLQTHLDVRLTVSKGYYVRSLAKDLGDSLGVPAHLSRLRRVASGPFQIDGALPWPVAKEAPLLSLRDATRSALPSLQVTANGAERLAQGKRLLPQDIEAESTAPEASLQAAFHHSRLIALVEPSGDGEMKVKRGINDPDSDE